MHNFNTQNQRNLPPRLASFLSSRPRDVVPTSRFGDAGQAQFEPSEFELRDAQRAETEASRTPGGATFTPSRESLRKDAMQRLRRGLALGQIEHGQALERDVIPAQVKGAFDVEAARVSAEAAEARAEASSNNILERLLLRNDATAGRQDVTQEGLDRRQESGQQFKLENPTGSQGVVPQGLFQALTEAEGARPTSGIGRMFDFGGAKANAFESALTNVLDRQGSLDDLIGVSGDLQQFEGSLDERIGQLIERSPAFADYLRGLDLRERQYLELKLGQ